MASCILSPKSHGTAPGPWPRTESFYKQNDKRAMNEYPGLTQGSMIHLARWDFAALRMTVRTTNYIAFTKRGLRRDRDETESEELGPKNTCLLG